VAPLLYTPYQMVIFAACILVTWGAPQSWDFTRTLTPQRVAWIAALFVLGVSALWTQTENPFLYFQF
ncbi:MAG: hypothetical protein ACOCZK_03010, partial [Planctomycetota bacterium]